MGVQDVSSREDLTGPEKGEHKRIAEGACQTGVALNHDPIAVLNRAALRYACGQNSYLVAPVGKRSAQVMDIPLDAPMCGGVIGCNLNYSHRYAATILIRDLCDQ